MNLNQLIYFASLAQLQHVTRASEKLNIAQPSLSKAIANLEQELGVDLFEKQGRNVVLTRQGKLYLDYVEKALESLEEGRSALQRMQTELDQRICVFPAGPDDAAAACGLPQDHRFADAFCVL